MSVKKIENNESRVRYLPPTDSFPLGVQLRPGLNTVPQLYFDEWFAVEVKTEPRETGGKKVSQTRYPGKEEWERLTKQVVKIVTVDGVHRGPVLTEYEPDQVADREDGPALPETLAGMNETVALTLIERTRNREALKAWAEERGPQMQKLAQAARNRLSALS